jgi:hypothetical protein
MGLSEETKSFENKRLDFYLIKIGASGFEPPASWSRTKRSIQAELRPEN